MNSSIEVSNIDYTGNIIYQNNMISYIITTEGRLTPKEETFNYEYYLQDHLGNTRVVFNQDNQVLQTNSYYPFGMNIESLTTNNQTLSPKNLYLYNGKELQEDFNLNWHDYGFRFYDAQIGRWHVIDPMADSRVWLTPYQYAQNTPIMRIDPDGMLDDGIIRGPQAERATTELNKTTNLRVIREEDGKLKITGGSIQNNYDRALAKMITDKNIRVILNTREGNYTDYDARIATFLFVGSFEGNTVRGNGNIDAYTVINMDHADKAERIAKEAGYETKAGNFVGHEMLESYIAAKTNPGANKPMTTNTNDPDYTVYLKSHNKAVSLDSKFVSPESELYEFPLSGKIYYKNKNDHYKIHRTKIW